MKSHTYDFPARVLLRLLVLPVVPAALIALALRGGTAYDLLPPPRPALDMDSTLITHQVEASRLPQDADVLLLGDSSCLMNVSALGLQRELGAPHAVLNLATLSYLDLHAYAKLVRAYTAANPGRLKTLVLLLHPEMLRGMDPSSRHLNLLEDLLEGTETCPTDGVLDWLRCGGGIVAFENRILSRALPRPLSREYGARYGFTTDLDRYLTANRGSMIDPRLYRHESGEGNAEYRLGAKLESGSRAVRAAVPAGARLVIGLTPVPASFARSDHATRCQAIRREWNRWLEADAVLDTLPAVLADDQFASTTHLNARGIEPFTQALAGALRPVLQ